MKKILFVLLSITIISTPVWAETFLRQKNVASYIVFPIMKNDGTLISSAAGLDSEIDVFGDGAAPDGFADCTNEATEIGSTGQYYLLLTQTEMNNDYIIIQTKSSSTGAVTQTLIIRTMVGDPLLLATTDDGGVINVTTGKIDEVNKLTEFDEDNTTVDINGTTIGTATNVTNGVTVTTNNDKTGYTASTVSDKTGYALSESGVDAVWEEVTTGHTTVSSYGKLLTDYLDAAISSRSSLTASDNIGINWADISNPTTTVSLSGTTISSSQAVNVTKVDGSVLPTHVTGYFPVDLRYIDGAAVSTAAAQIGVNAVEIGGNVPGGATIGTVTNLTNAPTAGDFTATMKTSLNAATPTAGLSAAAVDDIWNEVQSGHTTSGTFGKYLDAQVSTVGGGSLTVADIADGVWEEAIADHLSSGTTGNKLNAAASAGDPWSTSIPGSYGAGTAGYILGTNLNTTVSSRSLHSAADVWSVVARTITGGTVTTNSDKTGYSLTQAFPTNFSSLSITAAGKVAVATNDDKTGYTASTVSDKTGYSLSSSQTFNLTGSITGNLSGSVGSVTGAVGSVTSGVIVTTNNDKTGYALSTSGVDAIWDEAQSGHTLAGTFGKYLDAQVSTVGGGSLTNDSIADAVLDELLSGHTTAGSLGKAVSDVNTYTNGAKDSGEYNGIEKMIRIQR